MSCLQPSQWATVPRPLTDRLRVDERVEARSRFRVSRSRVRSRSTRDSRSVVVRCERSRSRDLSSVRSRSRSRSRSLGLSSIVRLRSRSCARSEAVERLSRVERYPLKLSVPPVMLGSPGVGGAEDVVNARSRPNSGILGRDRERLTEEDTDRVELRTELVPVGRMLISCIRSSIRASNWSVLGLREGSADGRLPKTGKTKRNQ